MTSLDELRAMLPRRSEMGMSDDIVDAVPALLDVVSDLAKQSTWYMTRSYGEPGHLECVLCAGESYDDDFKLGQHFAFCPYRRAREMSDEMVPNVTGDEK